jgi:prepilin-type N-terminal cleavage/methylation domain-containing protein
MSRHERGFTLVETIMVIVLLGAGMAAILSVLAEGSRDVGLNSNTQIAARYVQERIEQIIADRRNSAPGYGFARITAANYPGDSPSPGLNRTIAIVNIAPGTQGCPATTAGQCRRVLIQVRDRPLPAPALASATLMVTNY